MDRCRCEDYAEAVRKLRFYTVGTLRPDIIDNYDRSAFTVEWIKHGIDYSDMKFLKPRAWALHPSAELDSQVSDESRRIDKMWCPYMTPVKQ